MCKPAHRDQLPSIIGVVFTVLIVGRIVTVLPRIDSVIKYSPDE